MSLQSLYHPFFRKPPLSVPSMHVSTMPGYNRMNQTPRQSFVPHLSHCLLNHMLPLYAFSVTKLSETLL